MQALKKYSSYPIYFAVGWKLRDYVGAHREGHESHEPALASENVDVDDKAAYQKAEEEEPK